MAFLFFPKVFSGAQGDALILRHRILPREWLWVDDQVRLKGFKMGNVHRNERRGRNHRRFNLHRLMARGQIDVRQSPDAICAIAKLSGNYSNDQTYRCGLRHTGQCGFLQVFFDPSAMIITIRPPTLRRGPGTSRVKVVPHTKRWSGRLVS